MNTCVSEYCLIPLFLLSFLGISLYSFLLFLLSSLKCFFTIGKTYKKQNALPLLCFYAFKTLCFYSKLSVYKPDFPLCLITIFTTCTKTLRQIKRLIVLLTDAWHTLVLKGSAWLSSTAQSFGKQNFTL